MPKKLGARWMPGHSFLDDPRVSHVFANGANRSDSGEDDLAGMMPQISKDMALVLVLAQDSNVKISNVKGW